MKIKMAGIDYHKAPVEVRELFSMTASVLIRTLKEIKLDAAVGGCIILNTCNRTELWLSGEDSGFDRLSPAELLCRKRGLLAAEYLEYFTERSGDEAMRYLFELACGLDSQIFGDDQIITQVRQSLVAAREQETTDAVLETLFRMAVTGAKKVKSKVRFTNVDRSVSMAVVKLLRQEGIMPEGLRCMVIGNGEIGRLTAEQLVKAGAHVSMTLRQYKTREAIIPAGCHVIDYQDRYACLQQMDIVVSATLSPHYTLTWEQGSELLRGSGKVLVDLAIPRDIEPGLGSLEGVRLYDMDSFSQLAQDSSEEQTAAARKILREYEDEYVNWYRFRDWVPVVQQIAQAAGEDAAGRVQKELKKHGLEKSDREELYRAIEKAAVKAVAKLCYGLREELDDEELRCSLEALDRSARNL